MHPKLALCFPKVRLLAEPGQKKIARIQGQRYGHDDVGGAIFCPFAKARQSLRQFRSSRWMTLQCGFHHARDP